MIRVALTPWCTNRIVSQVGMIAPFFLAPDALPTGWRACDGNHSTPDLRGKFLIGAGSRTVPMNQGDTSRKTFVPAEPLRMEVLVGDWVVEAGDKDPDPPGQGCGVLTNWATERTIIVAAAAAVALRTLVVSRMFRAAGGPATTAVASPSTSARRRS